MASTPFDNHVVSPTVMFFHHFRVLPSTINSDENPNLGAFMPNVPTNNMPSKLCCPNCGCFNMKRLHRSYVRKIFNQPFQYKCLVCKEQFSDGNEIKKMPAFISDREVIALAKRA